MDDYSVLVPELAEEIGVDPKTVREYVYNGLIDAKVNKKFILVSKEDADWLVSAIDSYRNLQDVVKKAYTLFECGADGNEIVSKVCESDAESVDDAVSIYEYYRDIKIADRYKIKNSKDIFLITEFASMLNVTDRYAKDVILSRDVGSIKKPTNQGVHHFPYRSAIKLYMGEHHGQVLYTIDDVCDEMELTKDQFFGYFGDQELGLKLKVAPTSVRMYSRNEIHNLERQLN